MSDPRAMRGLMALYSSRNDFLSRVSPCPITGCWWWTGTYFNVGYGKITRGRTHVLAHRVAWELFCGAVPPGLCVLHRCDNRECVNPAHLFLGTRGDNNTDRARKGRGADGDRNGSRTHPERLRRGETCHLAKLTVRAVRAMRHAHGTQAEIARRFGVSESAARAVLLRKTWKHV